MKPTLALAALIALGAATAPLPSLAQTHFEVVIGSAPPAPVYERIPGPRHGHVWAPGYWEWRGHRHAWVPGHYIAARPGYAYAPPVWRQGRGGWYLEPARWSPYGQGYQPVYAGGRDRDRDGVPDRYERPRYDRDRDGIPDRYERQYHHDGRRDTDRDGVPNRHDRDLDNDGVRNEYDRDRDGDGVRNRYDRRPENPYRY
ncbi:YXWGXW repeat-containing protein [Massilia sp. ST3]|uniref:YXWGXW repeat-containing protein n=1 Tax=Massilia sp. ST3 TaxID=2824903 RepID=UPI001B83C747|nr:YXWGXW repeat-containing protein [Massilia sp. ST3]MBQ5947088.1 YXWGXW repeat-containing protein [Massilia sp. ST3]